MMSLSKDVAANNGCPGSIFIIRFAFITYSRHVLLISSVQEGVLSSSWIFLGSSSQISASMSRHCGRLFNKVVFPRHVVPRTRIRFSVLFSKISFSFFITISLPIWFTSIVRNK